MFRKPLPAIPLVLSLIALVAACGGTSGPLGSVPVPSATAEPSVDLGSPDVTPGPSDEPSDLPSESPDGSGTPAATPSATPSSAPSGTTIVRAYFWLDGLPGSAGLVAVLREIPATKGVATAAVNALLAGPTAAEDNRNISTTVPDGSQLLGLSIDSGVATVDLSSEFESGGGSASVVTRLGQLVYTLTQFPTVKSVVVQIEGETKTVFGSEGVVLDKPATRADYVDLLPAIWVDRPAFNAAIGNPAHITGNANVFEAMFRIAILDGSGKVLVDQSAMATCGTGCRGTFDVTLAYAVSKAQYGILRVYDPSEKDGTPESIRDYRVWLTPKK
ncbi:MAG TPA: GerMN domain-containing protein [Candidatus Limnocylindrales bacterium]|nr:GerMN domain-containing protein [Candidatus Limnocylindrales bacterium]